jgi:four helix bundle protein
MKYLRFGEPPVWKDAIEGGTSVLRLTAMPVFRQQANLRSQLERAAVSVSNNIAERFERELEEFRKELHRVQGER